MNRFIGALFVYFFVLIALIFWIDRTQLRNGKIKKSIFFVPPMYRLRISLWILALTSLPIIALHFQGWEMFYFALLFAIVFTLLLVTFYGMFSSSNNKVMKVTSFYSRGTLIFVAMFWSILIGLVSWYLYVLAP